MKTLLFLLLAVASCDAADTLRRIGGFAGDASPSEASLREEHARHWAVTNSLTPWRIVAGQTNNLAAATNWFRVRGKVEQVGHSWALVTGAAGNESCLLSNKSLFIVRGLPFSPAIGETLPEGVIGKSLGDASYKAATGERRLAHVLDHGAICEPQASAALALQPPRKQTSK